jgi:hypothetical protein
MSKKRLFQILDEINKPEPGEEVLLYNEKWISDDNPKGIRVGFWCDVQGWVSAYWCNYHDEYHTRVSSEDDVKFEDSKAENQIPTHWMSIEADLSD